LITECAADNSSAKDDINPGDLRRREIVENQLRQDTDFVLISKQLALNKTFTDKASGKM
jgi:hypothetical protein